MNVFGAGLEEDFLQTGLCNFVNSEMGGACGMYGGRERCAQGFGGET